MLLVISITTGCNNSIKSEDYSGKQYYADIMTEQLYHGHYYFQFNFKTDSTCTYYNNLYDQKQDKYYGWEKDNNNWIYRYYVDKKHLVLVKTGVNGADTMRLEISGNNLIWNHEEYPHLAELPPITLIKSNANIDPLSSE
jgi:hypothetical protein